MAAVDISRTAYALKTYYSGRTIESAVCKDRPFVDMVLTKGKTVGKGESLPMRYEGGQGISNTFADAQANNSGGLGVEMVLTTGDMFGTIQFDNKLFEAEKSPGSIMDTKMMETADLIDGMGNKIAQEAWGNGGARLGAIAAGGISGNVITLSSPSDVHNFHVGEVVVFSAGDGSLAAHTQRAGSTTVTVVDRSAGTITVNNLGDVTGEDAGDSIFRGGSFAGAVSQTAVMKGVRAWIPITAPGGSDSFFSANRSVDDRLSGYRLPAAIATGDYENILKKAIAYGYQQMGVTANQVWVDPLTWDAISRQMQNANGERYIDVASKTGSTGYKAIRIMSAIGECALHADRFAPQGLAYFIDPSTWELRVLGGGDMVKLANKDVGNGLLRRDTAMAYEMRWYAHNQVVCAKPWKNAVAPIPLPTA